MIVALLLAAAAPATALDAERAFAADAQAKGQWTAFTAWSTADATMFTPQPVNVHAFLKDRKDPPKAVSWAPAASFTSCDGALAVNTGPWTRDGGKTVGYFTTVWQRQRDGGWKWTYDGGDSLAAPRPLPPRPLARIASCDHIAALKRGDIVRAAGARPETPSDVGRSPDGTLVYSWVMTAAGARSFSAYIWNGRKYDLVVEDRVAAPRP